MTSLTSPAAWDSIASILSSGERSGWSPHTISSDRWRSSCPATYPIPRDAGWRDRLESLLRESHLAMGGSTLTLFTNRRDMDALYRAIEPDLDAEGIGLIVQSRGVSAKRLRDEFVAEPTLSLFATKSFWEGFDAKGDTLRCVIVPRLPFGRPSDPLAEEREVREGRAAWAKYALPQAVLELKQAAGRLIRSSTDTGCLIIADTRVLHKAYGRKFLDALPVRTSRSCPPRRSSPRCRAVRVRRRAEALASHSPAMRVAVAATATRTSSRRLDTHGPEPGAHLTREPCGTRSREHPQRGAVRVRIAHRPETRATRAPSTPPHPRTRAARWAAPRRRMPSRRLRPPAARSPPGHLGFA